MSGRRSGQSLVATFVVGTATCNSTAFRRTCHNGDGVLLAAVRDDFAAKGNVAAQAASGNGKRLVVFICFEVSLQAHIHIGGQYVQIRVGRCHWHLACVFQSEIIDVEVELVGAVEVTNSNISVLIGVATEIDSEVVPCTTVTVAFAVASHIVTRLCALGSQCGFIQQSEVAGVCVASRRDIDSEMLCGIVCILGACPHGEGTSKRHLRRDKPVVGSYSAAVVTCRRQTVATTVAGDGVSCHEY